VNQKNLLGETQKLEKEISRAVRPYVAPILFFYDVGVYKIWNPSIWKCPSSYLEEHYHKYVSTNHLEAGCGTGYLLNRCEKFKKWQDYGQKIPLELTLLDYSQGSLKWAERKLKMYNPTIIRHNLLRPLPQVNRPFKSIGLNYVLHCLPGSLTEKEKAIINLKEVLAPEGVLFGSTVLGHGAAKNYSAKLVLALYNTIGSFHNKHDTLEGLKKILSNNFKYQNSRAIGSVILFAGSDRKI
jgi:SAM-dependent methyltransferase